MTESGARVQQLMVGRSEGASAVGSVSLVRDASAVVLVDTASPWDAAELTAALAREGVAPADVTHVVCTHGHIDHVGNLSLFTAATIYLDNDVARPPGHYTQLDWDEDEVLLTDRVSLIKTPGHTAHCLSLVVRQVPSMGVVVVAGDLFESEADITDAKLWKANSTDIRLQKESRTRVLKIADWIIPGHGPIFKIPSSD